MSATTDLVDAMNDDLSPFEEEKVEEQEVEETEKVEETTEEAKDDKSEDDDDGYVIDDEEEEKQEEKVIEPAKPTGLTTEQQFIYDNLPSLSIQGKDGKVYEIKTPNELPNDFEFANARDQANFYAAIASQELKATNLQAKFQNDAASKSAEEFATREDRAITDDIANLQKSGELARFKVQPTDPKFDEDPTAKQVNEIINFMNKKNDDYLKRNQAGQAYRHIGFEEAFYLYRRENPEKARSTEQKAEDTARKEVARNIGSRGTAANQAARTPVIRGTSTQDLLNMIDNLE